MNSSSNYLYLYIHSLIYIIIYPMSPGYMDPGAAAGLGGGGALTVRTPRPPWGPGLSAGPAGAWPWGEGERGGGGGRYQMLSKMNH